MNRIYRYLTPLLCLLSLNTVAEYKTAGQMTRAEHKKVSESSAKYNECLNESAISQLEDQTDARIVTDYAMKDCASILEGLYNELLLGNYAPPALKHFINRISNKGANKLLANVMRYMANKKNQ